MAALDPKQLKEAEDILKRLNPLLGKLGEYKLDLNLVTTTKDLKDITDLLEESEIKVSELEDGFGGLSKAIKAIGSEIKKGFNDPITNSIKSYSKLKSIAEKLKDDQLSISTLTKDQLKTTISTLRSEQTKLSSIREELEQRTDLSLTEKSLLANLQSEYDVIDDLIKQTGVRLEQENQINKKLGLTGVLLRGMTKIPVLGEMVDVNKALDAAREKIGDGGSRAQAMGAAFKQVGGSIKTHLTDPLLIGGILVKTLIDILTEVDSELGHLAQGFNISYKEAYDLREELTKTALATSDTAINVKGLQESLMAVGKTLGSNAKLNTEDLITFTKLREQAGYTNDELMGMQLNSLTTGKSLKSNTAEFLGAARATASNNKLIINEKQLLKEVANTSGAIKLSLGGSSSALAEAAVKAKLLGTDLNKLDDIAGSLLDFESSISNELEAELLTGKNLNLEKAREAALNGDLATVAEEIKNQVGGTADFAKMNRIQQEALAKAVGMTREELGKSVIEGEALSKLSGEEGKTAKEKFDNLVKQVGLEQAKKQLGDDQLANQFQQQSIQDRLSQSIDKIKETFVAIAEPILSIVSPLMDLVSSVLPAITSLLSPISSIFVFIADVVKGISGFFGKIGDNISNLIGPLGKVGKIIKGIASLAVIYAAYNAYASLAAIPFIGVPLGIAAAAAVTAAGFGLLGSIKDGAIDPNGGLIVSGEKGSIQLDKQDSIVAGTNLGGGSNNKSSTTNNESSTNSQSTQDMSGVVAELGAIKLVLSQILNKEGIIMLDSTKVGTALNVGTAKIQ